jgi:hypothetical protein
LQSIYETRGPGDGLDERDWRPGGPEGSAIKAKSGTVHVPWSAVIADPHTPCWLCEPGYVCAFHRSSPADAVS